jgi:hypothetical protein
MSQGWGLRVHGLITLQIPLERHLCPDAGIPQLLSGVTTLHIPARATHACVPTWRK